ncbi:DinB family protein [Ferdinandcohnia quinoae]|uniref:DUF664 domain-containing protein n=1 Tax=Fredinandcohnia quinoae TaxID=2918902 RepID=A0AAW5EEG0_9BACI|nr:DinB family protein [Fredinandcohnia sp. SECRCQ15]MCH1627144.1 DUF664 domain-containing protein [Fredinandcohnia sp. SECRCQ15]
MIDYRIVPKEGFSIKIGELVSMLEHTREVTLTEISNLSQSDIDYLKEENDNTIGALLLHIASIEAVHQVISFENRDFNEQELRQWKTALELGENARLEIKKETLDYYYSMLSKVRKDTLRQLKARDDQWLYEEKQWPNGTPYNNYYLWYHVMEDEINHRGQIRTIKRFLYNSR